MSFDKPAHAYSSGLSSLPTELLLLIAEYVPNRDLCHLILASQRMYTALTDTLYLRNIHERDSSGLAWAARKNYVEVVCRFLRLNANVHTTPELPPLLSATLHENLRLVKILIKAGARTDIKISLSSRFPGSVRTPLGYAVHKCNTPISRILIDAIVDLETPILAGLTPLGLACYANHVEIAKYLLEKGVKPSIPEAIVDKLLNIDNKILKNWEHEHQMYSEDQNDVYRWRLHDGPLAILRLLVPHGLEVSERQRSRAQTHSDPRVRYLFMAASALKEANEREDSDQYIPSEVEYNEVFPPLAMPLDAQVERAPNDNALQKWLRFRETSDAPCNNITALEPSETDVRKKKKKKEKWSKLQL